MIASVERREERSCLEAPFSKWSNGLGTPRPLFDGKDEAGSTDTDSETLR